MEPTKVLVTGATGFLGKHLVVALRGRGFRVVATARQPDAGVEPDQWIVGDLCRAEIQTAAVQGCAYVVNAAGVVKKGGPDRGDDEQSMYQLNCLVPEALAVAAERAGVKRFLHISSTGVYGSQAPAICTEETACHPENAYEKSKRAGELRLIGLTPSRMAIVIARPSNVFGEWHAWNKLLSWMKAVQAGTAVLAGLPEAAIVNYVYVGDVTEAALGLLTGPGLEGGGLININTPATMAEFHRVTAQAVRRPGSRPRVIPRPVLLAAATALDGISRVTRRTFPLTREKVGELTGNRLFSSARLTTTCPGFPSTGLAGGLARLAEHYRLRGLL